MMLRDKHKKRQTILSQLGRSPPDLTPEEYEVLLQLRRKPVPRRRIKKMNALLSEDSLNDEEEADQP